MSVVALVVLSLTPIVAMGILLGIDRFERYVLERGDTDQRTGLLGEAPQTALAAQAGITTPAAAGQSVAAQPVAAQSVAAQTVADASRPAA